MPDKYSDIRVIMDLPRLGELIAHVAVAFAQIRGLEPPDFDGQEMKDLAVSGWRYCMHMHDRAEFAASVQADLEKLSAPEPQPEHRPEFGGAATPNGWDPPV